MKDFKDIRMSMYAYSTFHPRNAKASATPAVAFSLDISNPTNEDLKVSYMFNLPFGYQDDTIRRGGNFAEVAFTRLVTAADCQRACAKQPKCMAWTTNGPFSCMLKDNMPLHAYEFGIISGLKGMWEVENGMLTCTRPGFYAQSGQISLYPLFTGAENISFGTTDDAEKLWKQFTQNGKLVVECSDRTILSCLQPVCLCCRRFGRYFSHHHHQAALPPRANRFYK